MDQEADIRADDGRVFAEELLAAARPRAEPRDAASHRRRRRRQGRLDAFLSMNDDNKEEEEEEDGEDGKDAAARRTRPARDAATNSSAPSTRTAVHDADEPARPAPAPRRFPHTLDSGSMIAADDADAAADDEGTADGERTLRVACALFKAGRRADGTATPAPTRAESIEWRRAMSFFGGGGDGFSR